MRAIRRSGAGLVVALSAALFAVAVPAQGTQAITGPATPAHRPGAPGGRPAPPIAGTIKAVVVKSWGGCSSAGLVWDDLNLNWSNYGTTPIQIDYSDPSLCGSSFTLAALEASGANVVILSDPSGGPQQYSAS